MQNNNNSIGGNGSSITQLPIFKGVNYHFWSLKMKTLFRSQELWSIVEDGFTDDAPAEPSQDLRDKRKKDAKALYIIQQSLDDEVFPRIAAASTSKEAWSTLKQEYLGDKKVIAVRLQSLRREFETSQMKEKETVQEYLSRISSTVQQMRSYGEEIKTQQVVSKVSRSLTNKFDYVVTAIEESKDTETYTFDELMGSLQAHEERHSKSDEKKEEKAFHVKGESSNKEKSNYNAEEEILGKKMKDWLRFSIAFWHTFRGTGADPFGTPTKFWPWVDGTNSLEMAKRRLRANCSAILWN